jgi:hypothetical protein
MLFQCSNPVVPVEDRDRPDHFLFSNSEELANNLLHSEPFGVSQDPEPVFFSSNGWENL